MKSKIGIYLLFFVVTLDVVLVLGGQFQGCYKENKRRRIFNRNPGDFKPNSMTPAMCAAKCGSFSFSYAAIAEGKFCFCADTLPDVSQKDVNNIQCSYKCSGEPATNCGSDDYVSVYSAAPPILGLTLASSASGVVGVHTLVTFTPGVASAGADLAFQVDFDDDAGKTDKNATGMWQKTYHKPGLYEVSVFGNDNLGSLMEKEATTTVVVNAPVKGTQLTCESYLATHEDSHCDVSVLEGSNMELKFYEDDELKTTFPLADPILYQTGPAIPSTGGAALLSGEVTSDTIVMPASEFMYKGVLIHFEVYAEAIGSIEILILSPACTSPPYCFDQNDCSSGCSGIHEKTCTSKEFCPSAMNCWTSGSNTCDSLPVRYAGTQRTNLNIEKTFLHTITHVGYNYIPVDVSTDKVEVQPGYIIGYKPTTGRLKAVSVAAGKTDVKTSDVSNKASATVLSQSKHHLLRAVTSGGSNAYIPVNYQTPGVKDITVTARNLQITGSENKTAQIIVNEGIDKAVMVVNTYIEKGVAVSIQLLPHTGTNVTYWYEITDGTSVNTTNNPYSHTFNTIGQHNISINAFNPLSSKMNMTTVYVQERISPFVLSDTFAVVGETTSIPFPATTGSDYTCIWKKVGTQIATTDDTTTPPSGSYDHTFTSVGSFLIAVSCSNEINTEGASATFTTQYRITNLRLVKTGALKDTEYTIGWEWDAGTEPTFILEYNNANPSFTKNMYFNKAETETLGPENSIAQFPLNLTAYNDVSREEISIQFGIEENITNPLITSSKDPITDYAIIGHNQAVTFTVDATGGTNVNIEWNYTDGTANDVEVLSVWISTQSKIHTFTSLGLFNVEVKIYNLYSSVSKTFKILAITPIQNLGMTVSPLQDLFEPPARVSISFTKNPADPDPYDATLYFDYGNGADATLPFDVNKVYTYDYRENDGPYTITANVSNVLNYQILTSSPIQIVEKIEDIEISSNPEHAHYGDPITIFVKIRRADTGSTVRLGWSLGDGQTHSDTDRIGISPDGVDTITTTYNAIQTNTITITATSVMETVTKTRSITCQHKVKRNLQLTSNHPGDFDASGGVIDFTFEYTGTPQPTDAVIQVNYGDGQEEPLDPTWLTTASGASHSFSHTYTTDGNYITTVVLSNLVSKETFEINSGVVKPFIALAVTAKYKPSIPISGPDQPGLGLSNNVFPMHRPVKFHVTKTSGTHGYYSIVATSGPTVIMCNKTTEAVFELEFNETGTYGIQITALNAKYSEIVTTSIQIMKAVLNIEIADDKQSTDVNVAKVFDISFEDPGTSTCVYINFDDGTEEMYGNSGTCSGSQYAASATYPTTFAGGSFQVPHTFTAKNTYGVTAIAFNSISTTNTSVSHVVTSVDCSKPTIDIKDKKINFWDPTEIQRQYQILVTGITSIQCGTILDNVKRWIVEKVDPDVGTVESPSIDMSTITSRLKAQLDLPARFLSTGLYKFTYEMEMKSDTFTNGENFKSMATTYIKVVPSDMVGKIFSGGMTKIERGVNQMKTIAPKDHSYDPDLPSGSAQTFTNFEWHCRREGEEWPTSNTASLPYTTAQLPGVVDNGGCFKQGPGRINTNAGSLTFDTGNMEVNKTYEFKVKVEKGDHKPAQTSAFLRIVDGTPPTIAIRCTNDASCRQDETGLIIMPSNWLRLVGECSEGCDTNTNYIWKLKAEDYQWKWKEVEELENSGNSVGVNSKSIAINNALFDLSPNVTKYQVTLTATTASGDSGTVSTVLIINKPPTGGTCSIVPTEGTVLDTTFNATCKDWSDIDGIEEYQTYCKYKDDSILKQISLQQLYSGPMPLGPEYDDNNMKCFTRIKDKYGAFTEVPLGVVKVNPMPVAQFTAKMKEMEQDSSDAFDQIIAEGSTQKIVEFVNAYGSLISMDSDSDFKEYGSVAVQSPTDLSPGNGNSANISTTPMTPEVEKQMKQQYEEKREARAELASKLLDAMKRCTIGTMSEITQASGAVAEVTESAESCAQSCQESAANLALSWTDKIVELSDSSSKEDIVDAVTAIFGNIGNLQQAGSIHKESPTIGDKIKAEPYAIYDTELDSKKEDMAKYFDSPDGANDALLKYTNEDIQAEMSAKVDNIINTVRQKVRDVFQKHLVPGEFITIETPKMHFKFEKNDIKKFGNRKIEMDAASVKIPDMCDVLPNQCGLSKTLMLESAYSVYPPHTDADTTSQISSYIGALQLSLFDVDETSGNSITVANTAQDIEIMIPLDPAMPQPESSYINPYIQKHKYFQPHKVQIDLNQACLFIQIDADDPSTQFLIVFRKSAPPDITTRKFDHSCLVGPSSGQASVADGSLTNVCLMSGEVMNNYKGFVHFGIRQIQTYELERYRRNNLVPTSFPADESNFTTNYTLTTTVASCLYFGENSRTWKSDGCKVGPKTSSSHLQCFCNHLTTFSGGWAVAPNTIDWDFVFSNADFLQNPTLYITLIVITVLYLMVAVWARWKDKRDLEKLGLTPLADNEKKDKYLYEIVVVTGMRRKAGTDSKVQFILSGEYEESDVRTLSDNKRKILRRGTVDGFLLSSPRPLGPLNYLHIWHDNSGKGNFASWYLKSVVVRDVQTDDKLIFICNRWFAVEEDDGQVDRVIPVAGKEQMTEFSHLFTEKTAKSLNDGHLWFSVVARPPQSRFTRVQRVSCCLCLLYLSMLTNAMFYEKDSGTEVYTFGPFALSPEQIYIGVISNIIVFPVTFLIITLFRKSRPKSKRPSRIQAALNNTTKRATSMTDVNPTLENTREGTLTPSMLLEQKNRPDTSMSRAYTSLSVDELAGKPGGKKKKKLDFPWYFCIFAWILLWIATLVSAAFVLFYGIQFQDVKCKKWITSMLISFFASIFITQPIKVFLTAIIFSLIVKNPGTDDEEEEDDEERPNIAADEQLLHEDSLYSVTRPKRAAYAPPDPGLMEKARTIRMNEIKMWRVVREILFYSFFLWILMVISYRNRSELMYTYKNSMEQVFIVTNNTNHSFMKAKNMDDFWSWAKTGMVNGLRALPYYNEEQPLFLRGYINDKQSRIMGHATMRQLRVTSNSCIVPDAVVGLIHECNDEYSMSNQDEKSYDVGWKPLTGNTTSEEFRYTSAKDLEGYPYWGETALYGGGGYVVRILGNISTLRNKMSELEQQGWIDRYTRAIFVEFTVYNPGINLFSVSTMLAEFRPSQGILPSYRFEPVNLFPYMNSVMLFVLGCEITYLLFTVYFIFCETRKLYKQKLAYFREFWNLVEFGICSMSVTAVVIYFYRMFETNRLTERFRVSHGYEYMKFQYVGYWSETFSYIIGWLVFFSTLKFLKLLRFNKKICLLASTMKASCKDLLHFSVIFNIVFLAFIQLFYMIYVNNIKSFKTFVTSCESGIVMMMGKFDIYEMSAAQPVLTQIFLFMYVVMITFIVVNMFLSILNATFTSVRMDNNKQSNDYEIVNFMIGRLKLWTGIGTPDRSVLKPTSIQSMDKRGPTELFPEQIDRLLESISHIYMEKERLDELFDKNAYGKGKGADLPMYDPSSIRSLKYERMTMVHT